MAWDRKLTDEQYREILAAYVTAESARQIARRFGISDCTVFFLAKKFGVPTKGHRNKRQQIIRISEAQPELGPAAIGRLIGANRKYVNRVRTECGLTKRKNITLTGAPTPDQGGLQGLST